MAIHLARLGESPSIGAYSRTTDSFVMIPKQIPLKKAERFATWLGAKLIHTTIGSSSLIGALVCANSNGMLLPNYVRAEELETLRSSFKGEIAVTETRKTAYGNIVLANDHGAVVDPRMKDDTIKLVSATLGVEAVRAEIAGLPYVGSLAVATNKGALAHPLLKDSEKEVLERVLGVPVDVGTVNCGVPYVGGGLICNCRTAVAGSLTTGPEIFIIGNALDVVKENMEVESFQSNR